MRGTGTLNFEHFCFPSITVQRAAHVEMPLRLAPDMNSPSGSHGVNAVLSDVSTFLLKTWTSLYQIFCLVKLVSPG